MIIYGALLIPLITSFILQYFFNRLIVWWELFIPMLFSIIFVFYSKSSIETNLVTSNEFWGSFIDQLEYYEPWNEYITETCTRSCCCDADNNNCGTESYDCSYTKSHPPVYQILTTSKEVIPITKIQFDKLRSQIGNVKFEELNRDFHTMDGDLIYYKWHKDSSLAIPVTTIHKYENRVKVASQSVFNYGKVTNTEKEKYSLKDYPKIYDTFKMDAVLGDSSSDSNLANLEFQYLNGLLGPTKQVRFFVLIFKNQPIDASLYQEKYWSGGNKNEFVINIGIDENRNVKWSKVFSWSKSEILKTNVQNFINNQEIFNLQKVAKYVETEAEKHFVRRSFKEFDYLTVEPPLLSILLTYILTICINFFISLWLLRNNYYDINK